MTKPVPDRSYAERNDDLCDGRTHTCPVSRTSLRSDLTGEEVGHRLSNRGGRSFSSYTALVGLSFSDAENAGLGDDMISVQSHVVEHAFNRILDLLQAWVNALQIGRSNPQHSPFDPHLDLESLLQQSCKKAMIPTELLEVNLYHQ
jgi:hypothetical protein